MTTTETHQLLQQAALWHASRGEADKVFSVCDVADFDPGNFMDLAAIIVSLMNNEGRVDPLMVIERCGAKSPTLVRFFTTEISDNFYSTPGYCATKVREYADRRRLEAAITRAAQHISSDVPIERVIATLQQDIAVLDRPDDMADATISLEDILRLPDNENSWVLPNMFRIGERAMFTGMEGGGKSMLTAQLCIGAAMGVHTLSLGLEKQEQMRVLVLDVENSLIQVRNNARLIYPVLADMTGRHNAPIEWVNERYIDLANPVDAQRVIRLAKEKQPHLMFLGSVYKLASEGEKHEASFNAISRTVDRIRAETGAAVLLEAHTGHGFNNDRSKGSGMRPDGSSRWMRWPEYGMGMVPMGKRMSGIVELVPFRGARDASVQWPAGLKRDGVLPWTPIMKDEWEARYAER